MQDFLKDFEKRMRKLSYPFLIDSQVVMKTEWEKYGLKLQETINLIYSVLCLIMEKSLKDEECTYSDINKFLMDLITQYYDIHLSENSIYELSKYIIMRVLKNEGAMFLFEAKDYENNRSKIYQYHLVNQENSKVDPTKSTFSLSEEGYMLMLNSFEIDQKLKIEMESFIAEESIKRQNYKDGVMAIRNLENLITSQIQSIDNFILRTKENVLYIEVEEFNDSYNKNLNILRDQNKKFRELKQIIIKEKGKVRKLIENNLEREYMNSLISLGEMEKGLQRIIEKATKLISKHIDFSEEYVKALHNLSYLYNNDKLNIKEKLLKPIEDDINKIENIHLLLNSLFTPKVPKRLNLDKIFEEQRVEKKEEIEEGVNIDDLPYEDEESEINNVFQEKYMKIVRSIFKYIYNNKNTELKCLIEDYEKKSNEEYFELIPSIRLFTEVMIELIKIGEIDINEFLNEYIQSYATEKTNIFDLKSVLYEVLINDNSLKGIKIIRFIKKNDSETLEIKERVPKDDDVLITTIAVAKCNNYLLEVE